LSGTDQVQFRATGYEKGEFNHEEKEGIEEKKRSTLRRYTTLSDTGFSF